MRKKNKEGKKIQKYDRRGFITMAGATLASGVAAPALAKGVTPISWRLSTSFPKELDAIYAVSQAFVADVYQATEGNFQIQLFAPGEIVSGLEVMQAVREGVIDACHTTSLYYYDEAPTFALGAAIPFGLNSRQFDAWFLHGGGRELLQTFYQKHNLYVLPGGNTGCQMGGWFHKKIESLEDFKKLRMRILGLGRMIIERIGGTGVRVSGDKIYEALEKGDVDGAEWTTPYDDLKLGLADIAQYYYYPGWWEGGAALSFFVGYDKFQALPENYRTILEDAAVRAGVGLISTYDAKNPQALVTLVQERGVQVRPYPEDLMRACKKAANELYAELSAKDADFKKIYASMKSFQDKSMLWWQVSDQAYMDFLIQNRN